MKHRWIAHATSAANVLARCPEGGREAWRYIAWMAKATVKEEVNAYLLWFEQLARGISPRQGVVSRHYRSDGLTAYSRYSMCKPAVGGAPSICIADIAVEQPGHGFFTALCDQFEATGVPANVDALLVENVANSRFAAWLTRRGFVRCPYSGPEAPTLYLRRTRR